MITGAVFIDLRKAFDTVDHSLLITKLKKVWLLKSCHRLVLVIFIITFNSFVYEQLDIRSETHYCWSASRSILEPQLFLLYINDLPQCLNHCKSILHAYNSDNTLLYHLARTMVNLEYKIITDC